MLVAYRLKLCRNSLFNYYLRDCKWKSSRWSTFPTVVRTVSIRLLNWLLKVWRMSSLSKKRSWSVGADFCFIKCFNHRISMQLVCFGSDCRAVLWWNQSGHWQVLFRRRGHVKSARIGCRGDFNLLGEFGHHALRTESSRNRCKQDITFNARTRKG